MVHDLSRRSFLRSIILGAVAPAIIKPKFFLSMFGAGELYKPTISVPTVTWYTHPTLADWAKRMDARMPNLPKIALLLNQKNEILDDIPWMEGNVS